MTPDLYASLMELVTQSHAMHEGVHTRCVRHNVETTWAEMDWIGKTAIDMGICSEPGEECLLLSRTQHSVPPGGINHAN